MGRQESQQLVWHLEPPQSVIRRCQKFRMGLKLGRKAVLQLFTLNILFFPKPPVRQRSYTVMINRVNYGLQVNLFSFMMRGFRI